ncbi:MAG: pyridoxal phosphate-dependent aminotransferase [Chloroflexota bacterium]
MQSIPFPNIIPNFANATLKVIRWITLLANALGTPKKDSASIPATEGYPNASWGYTNGQSSTRFPLPTVPLERAPFIDIEPSQVKNRPVHNHSERFADRAVDRVTLRERAYNHRWAVQPPDVIPLTAADSDFPVAPEIIEAMQRYLHGGYLSYGPAAGLPEFQETVAYTLQKKHGLHCSANQVFATNSAASALYQVAKFVLTEPGDEAIIADPVDFLFERSVHAAGGRIKRLPLREDAGYTIDTDALEALIRPGKTKLLSICNPHNPLGRVWRRGELENVAELALRYGLWILSDEVWSDIVYTPHRHLPIAALGQEVGQRTFSVFGFSKGYGLAGLRLGAIVSPTPNIHRDLVEKSHANETAYGVSTLSQVAGIAAYQSADSWQQAYLAHLQQQRDYAVSRLNSMSGVTCHSPEGTHVLFPNIANFGIDSQEMIDLLLERHRVALVPGSPQFFGPGAQGHIRLSFATSKGILAEGLDRLETGLREFG